MNPGRVVAALRPRRSWQVGLTVGVFVLLVVMATVTIRFALWASLPYRGHSSSSVIIEIPAGAEARRRCCHGKRACCRCRRTADKFWSATRTHRKPVQYLDDGYPEDPE